MNNLQVIPENGAGPADMMAYGHAVQQVRTQYATAMMVQRPRKLAEVERRLLEEARLAGEEFYYGWRAGGEQIEGGSIDLAVAAARCWGNCATDILPVDERSDSWIFTAIFVDLETGYTRSRLFRQSKTSIVHGRHDEERKTDIRFQIGQSKAERNVILKALPSSLIRKAMEAAKAGVRAKIEEYIGNHGIAAAQDQIIKALGRFGIKEPEILRKISVAERKGLDVDHLVILRGDIAALEGGKDRPEELFPPTEQETKVRGQNLLEKAKAGKAEEKPTPVPAPEPAPPQQPETFDSDGAIAATEAENDIAARIRSVTTMGESNAVGADLMRCHAVLGEERYQSLLKQLQARNRELQGKGGAKTAPMF